MPDIILFVKVEGEDIEIFSPDRDVLDWIVGEVNKKPDYLAIFRPKDKPSGSWLFLRGFKNQDIIAGYEVWLKELILKDGWKEIGISHWFKKEVPQREEET